MRFLGTDLTRDIERDMFDYMPKEYEDYRESRAIVQAEAGEFERLNEMINDLMAQFFVDTATWGLTYWESTLGYKTNAYNTVWDAVESKNTTFNSVEGMEWDAFEAMFPTELDERRSAIKSRLRGVGTVTSELLKNVARSFVGGEINVTEVPAEYKIVIEFIDDFGVPSNIDVLKQVISEIVPAHLAVEYEYRYMTWSELDALGYTWSELDAKGLTFEALSTYKEG